MAAEFDVRRFVEEAPWRFARSMPWTPHWYVLAREVDPDDFRAFAELIAQKGWVGTWGKQPPKPYYDLDGWRYWTMSPPGTATLINREKVEGSKVKFNG